MIDCWMCLFFSLTVTLSLFPESFLVIKVAHLSSSLVSVVTRPVTEVFLWTEQCLDQGQAGCEHLYCAIPPTCLITLSRQGDLVNCLIWRLKYYAANVLSYGYFWVLFWIDGLCGIDFFFSLSNFCIGQPDFWSFMCYLGISFSVILSKSFLSFCIYSTLYKCIVILLRVLQIRLLISCCFAKEMVHPKTVDFDYVQNDQTNKQTFKYSLLWY